VVLYEMVTGRLPFHGDTAWKTAAAHANEPVPSARHHTPDLPRAADQVLRRALAKQPGDRYANAGALAAAWREALAISDEDLAAMRRELPGRAGAQGADMPSIRQTAVVDLDLSELERFEATEAFAPSRPPAQPAAPGQVAAPSRRMQWALYATVGTLMVAAIVSFIIAFAAR